MYIVNVTVKSNASGRTNYVAHCNNRQKTTASDPAKSTDANFGAAVGAMLDLLIDDRQRAMLRHPSGGQRVRFDYTSAGVGKRRFNVNV